MTTIDQRILIPVPPNTIWEYISNLANNPHWQVDSESLTFLSQRRTGAGTRWRQRTPTRQEFVYEVKSWYEGLGYEYMFIDGGTFQSCQGRLRLQEIPEGTIVQWTFTYELTGVFSGLRNALTTQRRIESDMVESLKTLWKISKRMGSMEGYQARSLMQDGPQSPVDRARYQPRRTSISPPDDQPATSADPQPLIPEPPISDEDTRPRPAIVDATHLPSQSTPPPPPAEPDTADDARFAPPATPPPAPAQPITPPELTPPPSRQQEETPPPAPTPPPRQQEETPPDVPEPLSMRVTQPSPQVNDEDHHEFKPRVEPGTDTAELSIWEVFGIPSPTDTQRMRAIKAAEEAEREYEVEQQQPEADATLPAVQSEPQPKSTQTHAVVTRDDTPERDDTPTAPPPASGGRVGLRLRARRSLVRVRRPGE